MNRRCISTKRQAFLLYGGEQQSASSLILNEGLILRILNSSSHKIWDIDFDISISH